MIKVKKITFGEIEGNIKATEAIIGTGESVDSIEKANQILFQLACLRTSEQYEHGYYNKCDITIEWVDGEIWRGRWDINSLELGKAEADCEIGPHILRHCQHWIKHHIGCLKDDDRAVFFAMIDNKYEL